MTHMINIQPRKPRFDLSDVPVFWNDGDPVLTRFFDALSIHFPDGVLGILPPYIAKPSEAPVCRGL